LRSVFGNSPPPKPEVILTNFFAEPTVLLVPITSREGVIGSRKAKKKRHCKDQKKKFEDTKGVIRSHKAKKERQCKDQKKKFEDTKGVIRSRKAKKKRPKEKGQKDKRRSTKQCPEN
jgi:hypothetical protein